jgi:hypothetical protein
VRLSIRLHLSISVAEIAEALEAKGLHLRDDGGRRLVVERVPRFLLDASRERIRMPAIALIRRPVRA